MSPPHQTQALADNVAVHPVSSIAALLKSFFPSRPGEVAFDYHTPHHPALDPSSTPVSTLVLSITPTAGFYTALHASRRSGRPAAAAVGFLHRPWRLDRRRLSRAATVLACHKGFDEALTVGYNAPLAARLGVDFAGAVCVQGYKGEPDRRIGWVGKLAAVRAANGIRSAIEGEFGGCEGAFGFNDSAEEDELAVVACMNAFHADEVERVVDAAIQAGFITAPAEAPRILYLTGAVRQEGLAAALAKGIKVVAVGHRRCEEWGLRYLATYARAAFPGLVVSEVYEEEETDITSNPSSGARDEKSSSFEGIANADEGFGGRLI